MENVELLSRFRDTDGTEKFVFNANEGIIEISWIKNKESIDVFCLPTHYYCTLGCKFCHLTEELNTSLRMNKISVDTLSIVLQKVRGLIAGNSNCLLSFMGVGEPFLNKHLISDIYKYLKPEYRNLSLAVSTMMPTSTAIDFFIAEVEQINLPLKLHFSMHSPFDNIRNEIMPASKVTVRECLEGLVRYRTCTNSNVIIQDNLSQFHELSSSIEIHYTIIDHINDSTEELEKLIEYGNDYNIPLKLLKFNPTKYLKNSTKESGWFKILKEKYAAPVSLYFPPGPNIGSSCGQFTKHYYLGSNSEHESQEFLEWKSKYQVVGLST